MWLRGTVPVAVATPQVPSNALDVRTGSKWKGQTWRAPILQI
jgi:hypothetical protein